jgi:hypothetical protein
VTGAQGRAKPQAAGVGMERRRQSRTGRSFAEALECRVLLSVAADRFEPNDSYDAAASLGTLGDRTENGLTIHAANNFDYFKFTAAATGAFSARFNFDQSQGDVDVFLLDSDRLLIDSSATTAGTERLDANVTAGRTYFIKVLGYAGATQPDYDMVIDGPNPPAGDTDDQLSEARPLSLNSSKADSISSGTDVDLYKLTVVAGQKVNIDVDSQGSVFDSYLRLFNSSGAQVKSNNDANAPGETATTPRESYVSHTFTAAGTYYVGVSGNANTSYNVTTGAGDVAGRTGAYVLRLVDPDTDDQLGEARSLSVGSSRGDSISGAVDVDLYKFTAAAGQKLGFDVDPATGSTLDSYLRVFNASGSVLASNDNRAAPGETLAKSAYVEYTFTTAGTYYVGVSGAPNSAYNPTTGTGDKTGSTGGYSLFLVNRPPAVGAGLAAPSAVRSLRRLAPDVGELLSLRDRLL